MSKSKRTLVEIARDLRVVFKHESVNIVKIGGLLIEAKGAVKHGDWLPWLRREFSMSPRSAQRYLQAHKFASKYGTVSHLSPTALYAISTAGAYPPSVISAVLKEAERKRVGIDRVKAIASALKPRPAADPKPKPRDEKEARDILDQPPDDLPPPVTETEHPKEQRGQEMAAKFTGAIETLLALVTKPSAQFVGLSSEDDLIKLADFLNHIAHLASRKEAA